MAKESFRGSIKEHEDIPGQNVVDTRPASKKFTDFLKTTTGVFAVVSSLLVCCLMFPIFWEVFFILSLFAIKIFSKKTNTLPFRLPQTSNILDFNDPKPGGNKPAQASGIAYFGNEKSTNKELWFKNDDMRTHIILFGSTGAGKALRMKEKIHTPSGWILNKDIKEGDWVTTIDGKARVKGVYPQGELELYSIIFEDGRYILVTGDHLWEIKIRKIDHKSEKDPVPMKDTNWETKVIKTQEFIDILEDCQDNHKMLCVPSFQANNVASEQEFDYFSFEEETEISQNIIKFLEKTDQLSYQKRCKLAYESLKRWSVTNVRKYPDLWDDNKKELKLNQDFTLRITELESQVKYTHNPVHQLKQLFFSLGLKVKTDISTGLVSVYPSNDYLRIDRVERTGSFEDCQCIKIDDERGLFVTKDYIVTHNTETLVSLAFNSLVHGSGFVYVDGKGDSGLWEKIFGMARSMGREDDLLIINYMTGSRDVYGPQLKKLSNTMNPFAAGSSGALTELLVSLMDDSGGGGDMWKGRAISLISAVILALVDMRDRKEILLDVDTIREYLILENIQKLAARRDLPNHAIQSLKAYLTSLPGYQEGQSKQGETTAEQHGYLQMQFTKILGSLADNYGYIFRTNLGEVDFWDVVINRRILVVLLPALEKSPEELSNLGKIIVASLKQMMASGLGAELEGPKKEIIDTKPTKSPTPFVCILDEYGYYAVKGAAVMPAQARGIGFSMIFAGQDYPALEKSSKEEAASTLGNCNIKIFMKLEDPEKTFDIAYKSGGKTSMPRGEGLEREEGTFGKKLVKSKSVSYSERDRINLLDLKKQREGEAHILFKDDLIRANMFFANPAPTEHMQLNHFLPVKRPEKEDMDKIDEGIDELVNKLSMEDLDFPEEEVDNFEVDVAKHIFKNKEHFNKMSLQNRSAAIITCLSNIGQASVTDFKDKVKDLLLGDDDEDENINIFSREAQKEAEKYSRYSNIDDSEEEDSEETPFERYRRLSNYEEDDEDDEDDEDSENEDENEDDSEDLDLLDEDQLLESFRNIENRYGVDKKEADEASSQLIDDMRSASSYPENGVPDHQTVDDIMNIIKEISDDFDDKELDD